jgi:hypothetical protein
MSWHVTDHHLKYFHYKRHQGSSPVSILEKQSNFINDETFSATWVVTDQRQNEFIYEVQKVKNGLLVTQSTPIVPSGNELVSAVELQIFSSLHNPIPKASFECLRKDQHPGTSIRKMYCNSFGQGRLSLLNPGDSLLTSLRMPSNAPCGDGYWPKVEFPISLKPGTVTSAAIFINEKHESSHCEGLGAGRNN